MIGLIDVGGGMRDIYGCGVTDYFIDNDIKFDLCIGVSAGSANIASFLANQRKRNYRFYSEYSSRKEYMSISNFFKTGSYFNLDYIYSTLSDEDGEDPIDYDALTDNPCDMITVVTNAKTGKPDYLKKNEILRNNLWAIKASCAVPAVCKPYSYNNTEYFDGGISDPLPIKKAFELGCDKVVMIVPRPLIEKKGEYSRLMKPFLKNYPKTLNLIANRPKIYNSEIKLIRKYIDEDKVILISPKNDDGVTMITTNKDKLTSFYHKGYNDAKKILYKF